MGTWIGHIAPGVFFVFFALWWHIHNSLRYLRSIKLNGYTFQGSTTYPCSCLPSHGLRNLPIESIMKLLITSIHFSIELYTGYGADPRPHIGDENAHHTAMLFGFWIGAWVEILVHKGVALPKNIPQVMGFLAFAIEALMMVFHLHARSMVDAHVHKLLALIIVCSMIGALGESYDPNNFWFIVGRSFFALTQGTWFLQIAFVIWPQTTHPLFVWDMNDHRSISLLTMSFAYHLAGNACVLIGVYLCIYTLYPVFSVVGPYDLIEKEKLHLINEDVSEYKPININSDIEENV
ncbi:unnamed protein product [Didymodactylos carnosus]|uniref:Transmembrane protein 45B n=1 Tax=Didymodactylos carnosus TaxID=1234261 RepID=A0A814IN78_9BILA|nr:unnamed protein product [Didymodactylos carnosus]CAF1155855.1 unnamed protein product [Didymodactylos carnosus]CAF3799284.1 unnamed protein product [Didymodactylos carnosus]CAF3966982.1 unnamed protein product [Didymodactylos carnosus]